MTEDRLEAIVRDLAARDPIAVSEISGDPYCTLCDAEFKDGSPEHHEADCPWRRAKLVV